MRTVLWGSLRGHARRYVAAGVAIVMAVAFMVAVNALSGAARDGARAEIVAQYAGADAVVDVTDADAATAARVAAAVSDVDGVEAVVANRRSFVNVVAGPSRHLMSIGTVSADDGLRWQDVVEGRAPEGRGEALVSRSTAERYEVAVGDVLAVEGDGTSPEVVVTGLVEGAAGALGSSLYVDEHTMTTLGDVVSSVDVSVRAAEGEADAVHAVLDGSAAVDGHVVMTGDAWVDDQIVSASRDIDIIQRLVLVFAAVAAFVGALVIANTITIVLAQRRRELALLRCVGATRKQIVRSLRTESLVLGLAASALGVVVGWGLGLTAVAAMRAWTPGLTLGSASLTVMGVVVPFVLGVLTVVGATVLPARRVARLAPLEALRPHETTGLDGRAGRLRIGAGVLLFGAGAAGLAVGTGDRLPVGLVGGMLSFLGVVVLAPLMVPAALRLVGPLVGRTGVAGRLAAGNVVRNPRRTASSSTALLVGVTLITTVVVGSASLRTTVDRDLDESYALDVGLVATEGALPVDVERQVAALDGVESVAVVDGARIEMDGHRVLALEVDDAAQAVMRGDHAVPGPGEIVIGEELASALDLSYGETAAVRGGADLVTMRPRGGGAVGEVVLVAPGTLAGLGVSEKPRALWARGADGAPAEQVMADVATLAPAGGQLVGGLEQRGWVVLQLDVVLAVTVGLLAVAVLIAAVGMAGALSLSVLERTRENALLRALGLSRRGLRFTLGAEALLMAGVGAVLGTVLGTAYGWLGVRATTAGLMDDVGLSVPWGQVALVLAAVLLLGLAASVLPSRRAARIAPAEGIAAL
ncbi:FtsX-like permease family protein [Mumia zhuanghuii]|uniref:FtsX-like permease family protein n=1 Tax=Mumia zhuanghuii TaxID=2585211 RepID=UPI00363DFE61